ncbi:MAG TPA: hypothetical protein VGE07_31815, partial [Herpetosiphonaceae bacterium]
AVAGDYLLWSSREETAALPRQQLRAIHLPSGRIDQLADLATLSTIYFDADAGWAVWNEEQQIKSVRLGSGEKAALVEDIGENAQYTRPSVGGINLGRTGVIWKENTGGQVPTFELRLKPQGSNESISYGSGTGDITFDFSDGAVASWEDSTRSGRPRLNVSLLLAGQIWSQPNVSADASGAASTLLSGPYVLWLERGCPSAPSRACERAWATHYFLGFTFELPFMPVDAARDSVIWTAERQGATDLYAGPLSALLPPASAGPPPAGSGDRYFPETGHAMPAVFAAYWQRNGATPAFGLPLTTSYGELNRDLKAPFMTQYTERQRFERHPEQAGTAYEIQLGLLGKELLEANRRDWRREGPFPPEERLSGQCVTFAETDREVCGAFLDYWRGHGLDLGQPGVSREESLALFGLPLTVLHYETNPDGDRVLTQWFERARFEFHPHNAAPYQVLLGRIGDELLTQRGW